MKPVKHLLTSSSKLVNVPELTFKKGLFNSPLSPKPKEKHSAKLAREKLEPMVLKSPPTGESIVRYALPIPSSKTKELIAEDELIRKITKHLKMVVSSLEEAYGYGTQNGEKAVVKPELEGLTSSVGDDLTSFLICCSQFATQLEAAAKEEHNILESLFKWFQRQVNQMEEISKDQTFSEAEFPTPDKTVSLSIAQIVKQVHKLEELKNRLKEGSKYTFRELLSKPKDREMPPEDVQTYETVKQKIEEFIKTQSTEEITGVSVTEPQTSPVTNQLNTMLKIFENQANKLERAMNDQLMLEAKYTQIQSNLQVLSEEKLMLENELQKLKSTEKTKATSERTKKIMKTEKKKDKGKSEDSEAKKSVGKELKVKENVPQVQKVAHALEIENKVLREQLKQALQEAERAKQQLAYFLNQEKELLTSEAKTKTTTEMGTGKLKVKGEDSKYIPLENETRKAVVGDAGGQKTNDKITHPQILKSQDGSPFLKTPSEGLTDEDLSHILSSKNYDKTFTTMLWHEEIKDAQSVGKLLQGNEMSAASFISPSVKRRMLGTDISKADIIEENLQTKIEKQTYKEAREFQASGKELDENPLLKNETPSETETRLLYQGTTRTNRRNAFLITEPKAMTIKDQLHEDIASVLNRQFQINREASGSGSFNSYDKESYEKIMLNHQDSVSKTEMQVKKQRTLKKERLSTHDKVRDKKHMHENQDSKIQQHVKIGKSQRREGHTTHDDVSDESPMFMQQDLKLETGIHVEKSKSSGSESVMIHEKISDANLMYDHRESMSKSQMMVKQQEEKKHTQDEVPDGNHMLDHQEAMSESEIQVKKESFHTGERFTTQDEVPDGNGMPVHQGSVSKSETQVKKQSFHKGEKLSTHGDAADKTPGLQHQESVSKLPVQEQKTSKGRKHSTQDEVLDGNPMFERQDSRSKSEIQVKKPSFHKAETLTAQDEVPDRNRILDHEDSVSKSEIKVRKPSLHKGERLTAPDDVPDSAPVLQHQDSVSKLPVQVQKQISSRGGGQAPDKVPSGNLVLEHEDSELKKEAQVKKQRTSIGERLKTHIGVPDKNLMVFNQYPVSKLQTQVENQINYRRERSQSFYGASGQHPLLVDQDLVSKPQTQVKKHIGSPEERRYTYPFQTQKNDMITVENLHPEKKDLFSIKQSQTQKPRAIKKENLDAQKARDVSSKDEVGSKSQSQTEKLRAGRMETLNTHIGVPDKNLMVFNQYPVSKLQTQVENQINYRRERSQNQDMDELSDEKFSLEDLVRTKEYKDKTQLSGVYQPQIWRIKRETTTEHPDITENLPEINPSIDDLIFQLDLNKVIEIDLEHLKDTVGRHIQIVENKTLAKFPPETHTEQYAEATGRSILKGKIKTQSKSHLVSDPELFPDIIGRRFLKSEFKTQPKNYLGTNIQGLRSKTGRGVIKGQFKTQSMNLPDTVTEHFPDAVGRSILNSGIKTQFKSHPGVNVFKNKDMSTQNQEEFFTGHITGSKFPMNVISFSQLGNQDLLKGKNTFLQQENVYARHVAPSKYKTKVITLSPFDDEDASFEDFSSYMTERPKVLHGTSKTGPGVYKAIKFPSLNKEHSGHQKKSTLQKKKIEHEETLPTVVATTRKPVYKVPYTTA